MKKRQGNKSAAAIAQRPSIANNISAANNDALFDRKIDLITEGIGTFFGTKLRELSKDNALTIINYVFSMKNEINLSDGYRKLNIYVLYRISKFFGSRKLYKEFTREDLLQLPFLILKTKKSIVTPWDIVMKTTEIFTNKQ